MAKLLLKFNMAVIKEIPISPEALAITVGRKDDNDIIIDNPAISGHHARIVRQGNKYFIEDLNSTNGTFISGKRILKAELQHNMQVDLAKHSLVYMEDVKEDAQGAQGAGLDAKTSDQTIVMDPRKQKEYMKKMAVAKEQLAKQVDKVGCIKITEGAVDKIEFELTLLNTYVGTEEHSSIRVRPVAGMFGLKQITGNLIVINRRPEGHYVIEALKEGCCKVDGKSIGNDIVQLEEGDLIELGKNKLMFYMKDRAPAGA